MQIQEVKAEPSGRKMNAPDTKSQKDNGQGSFMDILKSTSRAAENEPQKMKKTKKAEKPEHSGSTEAAAQQMAAGGPEEKRDQEVSDGTDEVKKPEEQKTATEAVLPENGTGSMEAVLQGAIYGSIAAGNLPADMQPEQADRTKALNEAVTVSRNTAEIAQAPITAQPGDAAAAVQQKGLQHERTAQQDSEVPGKSVLTDPGQKGIPNPKDMMKPYDIAVPEYADRNAQTGRPAGADGKGTGGQQAETDGGLVKEAQTGDSLKGMAEVLKQSGRGTVQQTEGKEPQVNLEKLQKEVDNKSYLDTGQMAYTRLAGVYRTDTQGLRETQVPVLKQVQTGIEQAVLKGQQAFSIRLKPEGLGEVIVHMASVGGKIAMSIGVSSQETQKLLSSEMAQLKEVLQPFHAEVKEIYQSQNGGMDMMAYQQNFYQQQRQQLYERVHMTRRTAGNAEAETLEEPVQQAVKIPPESAGGVLNAYV